MLTCPFRPPGPCPCPYPYHYLSLAHRRCCRGSFVAATVVLLSLMLLATPVWNVPPSQLSLRVSQKISTRECAVHAWLTRLQRAVLTLTCCVHALCM